MRITREEINIIVTSWSDIMSVNRDELIRLDAVAGDGDLGLSMNDGFTAVNNMLKDYVNTDIGKTFYAMGKTMNESASSSLGTLISAGFLAVGKAYRGKTEVFACELGSLLDTFLSGIIMLGKAKLGEKTFIDAFAPAVDVMKLCHDEEEACVYLQRAAFAAQTGAESTVGMLAKWGRAARRGEESRQLLDPGAKVAALMVKALADTLCAKQEL